METPDTSQLSDTEVFAFYKRTAPYYDIQFFLQHAKLSDELRAKLEALAATVTPTGKLVKITRADFYRRYSAIQGEWRRANNVAELTARKAAEREQRQAEREAKRAARLARLAARFERHRQRDPHCTCGDCIEAMETGQAAAMGAQ
jgi:predicted DNA-binding protein (UPF0278 family)